MSKKDIKVVSSWDELPPTIFAEGETFSAAVLEHRYRTMEIALREIYAVSSERLESMHSQSGLIQDRNHRLRHIKDLSFTAIPNFK